MSRTPETRTPRDFLHGVRSPVAALIRAFDWPNVGLAPLDAWPRCLTSIVDFLIRSPMPIVLLWGGDGVMIYNEAYASFIGNDHPAKFGMKVKDAWPAFASFNANVLEVVLGGQTLAYEDQRLDISRHGVVEPVWLNLTYSPVVDDDGVPVGVIAVVVETTRKVRAERWIRSESDRMHQMFAQAPGFMAMLRGPTHVFDFVNPAYEQLVGHRDVRGLTVRQALPEIEGQGFFELLDQVYTSGEAYFGASVAVSLQQAKDAPFERRFVDFVYQPVRTSDRRVIGVFVQGVDVTERVLSDDRLKFVENRNRQILDSAVDYAIVAIDPDGRVTRWNEGAHHLFGWTEDEMLGEDASAIFTAQDRAAGRLQVEMDLARTTGVGSDERWHVRKCGALFMATGETTPIRDDDGDVIGFVKVLRDRTEQHAAAAALARSEERLRRAQAAGGVGTFTCDIDSDTLAVTDEFCRIFGMPVRERVPVADVEALIVDEDRGLASNAKSRAEQRMKLVAEYRIRRADDATVRWIARQADYEHDERGRVVRLVGVVQDVTERKAGQLALEQSAAQFRAFAQATPNHVWTSPPDGRLDWFNDRTYEYSGVRPGELDGEGWASIVHPEDLAGAAEQWARSLASGDDYETEFRLRDASGAYRWHLARAVPIRDAGGTVVRWIGTNTDVHERKLEAVQNTRDRNRIWKLSRELMMVCDFEGRLVSINPAGTRILGWREDEMVGRRVGDFVHPDDLATTAAEIVKLAGGATTLAFENRYRTRDATYRTLNWTAVPEGGLIHAIARDVTDERTLEEALRQSQKMEAVGQLTGGLAHDFNNLLAGITGSLELLQLRMAQGRVADLGRYVVTAQGAARRAAALTHRLLAFSRRQTLAPKPTDVKQLVAGMEELIRRTVGPAIALETVDAADLWSTLIDASQLENAILNLCLNARDAMPDGGTITIRTANHAMDRRSAERRGLALGQYVSLSVEDTGVGMAPDVIGKAFEPFFTTKPIGMGTGLGLSMIYGFAKQSGGSVTIHSEPGVGSTLFIYLPRYLGRDDADVEGEASTDLPRSVAGETVLVVDDEPTVRLFVVEVLSDLGYAALEAGDGSAALDMLGSDARIDLLITDVGLPGALNGRQVADAARLLRPRLKVLFITGYAESAVLGHGHLDAGMQVLTKPFSIDAMAGRIHDLIGQAGVSAP